MEMSSLMNPVDVSIIVVAWNGRALVSDCLHSVYQKTKGVTFEVIYVDNGSADGTVEMVEQEFPGTKTIRNEKNLGFVVANNQAIAVSRGRYVLLLNCDTVLLDDAVSETVRFADDHPQSAVVGCHVSNSDMTLQRDCFMYPSVVNALLWGSFLSKLFPRNAFFGRELMTWWDFSEAREVEVVCGCFSLVRKKAIDQVGVMNQVYFMYGDDPDWCYRFKRAGWQIWFNPGGHIIHLGGGNSKSSATMARRLKWQLSGSLLIFMRLHSSALAFHTYRLLLVPAFLLRAGGLLAAGLFRRKERARCLHVAGTYLGTAFYALVDWKRLLINRDAVGDLL
jgi:GT2 family glycosyltransferase